MRCMLVCNSVSLDLQHLRAATTENFALEFEYVIIVAGALAVIAIALRVVRAVFLDLLRYCPTRAIC